MSVFQKLTKVSLIIVFCYFLTVTARVGAQNVMPTDLPLKKVDEIVKKSEDAKFKKADSFEFIAVVNEQPISQSFFDLNLQEWLAQGQKDSDQLRKNLKEELINRELIVQEVSKQGLDSEINWLDQIKQLKQKLALQIFTNHYLKEQGLNDQSLYQQFQNQKKQNNQNSTAWQYKIKQITLREKSAAIAIMGRLQQGESFDAVASTLPSSSGAITVGWINSNQIPIDLADAISKLPIGGFIDAPLSLDGIWSIIRLEDKRNSTQLTYEEYKNQVIQLKLRDFYSQTLKQLRLQAKIHQ